MLCPVCASGNSGLLFAARSPYPAAHGARYPAWACAVCGHRWCTGDVSPNLLGAIYGGSFHDSSQQRADDPAAPIAVNARTRAAWLAGQGLTGRLLDIGAGNGFFVRAAADAGFTAQGIELSPQAAEAARTTGADVMAGDFLAGAGDGPYDVITMWDVLSGMTDLQATMAQVVRLLTPGGCFVATVADGSARVARMAGRYWPLMIPPVNLHFFSRDSASRLLAAHGLGLQDWRHEAKRVSLRFLGQKLLHILGLNAAEPVVKAIPAGWRLSLDMGDIATLVARRENAP